MPPFRIGPPGETGLRDSIVAIGSAAMLVLSLMPVRAAAQDLEAARQRFLTSCSTCHAVEKDAPVRQGPNLLGVVGRKAGTLAGFKYSDALAKADLTWDEAAIDRWITDTQAVVPGSIMSYRQPNADKRRLVIAYLKSLSP